MMTQNTEYLQPLHFATGNVEVSQYRGITTVKVEWRQYLTATEIAHNHLSPITGEKWTHRRVNKMLEVMKYQQKPYGHWQPTIKGQHYADFSSPVLKWSPEVINLILQQLPQQLRLAV